MLSCFLRLGGGLLNNRLDCWKDYWLDFNYFFRFNNIFDWDRLDLLDWFWRLNYYLRLNTLWDLRNWLLYWLDSLWNCHWYDGFNRFWWNLFSRFWWNWLGSFSLYWGWNNNRCLNLLSLFHCFRNHRLGWDFILFFRNSNFFLSLLRNLLWNLFDDRRNDSWCHNFIFNLALSC